MSSVMHEMRLASATLRHTFTSRVAIAGADAGPAALLAFVRAMRGSLPSVKRRRWSLDWPAERMACARDRSDTVQGTWLAFRASAQGPLLSRADMAPAAASARAPLTSPDGGFQKTGLA